MNMFLISNSTTILLFQQNLQNITLLFGPLNYWTATSLQKRVVTESLIKGAGN